MRSSSWELWGEGHGLDCAKLGLPANKDLAHPAWGQVAYNVLEQSFLWIFFISLEHFL